MTEYPNRPVWAANLFVGMPAPAGAITALLPIYMYFLGLPRLFFVAPVTFIYTLAIAFLMVSRLPVFSGKRVGKRVAPEMVLPVFVLFVLFFALLIAYPWPVLTIGTLIYLGALPLGYLSYKNYEKRDAAAAGAAAAGVAASKAVFVQSSPSPGGVPTEHPVEPERPTRLN
jgi:CDP-diacylglycerol--serine O-phosphatidyltransferase